ncbi:M56 family metallopeptidase [Roseateles sp.]|uniref:M56 family metallopeptidase n=1 Tax=Roseateles sp. TaxID=1971397 RepID=UPI0025F967BA|nr:M56 family metallopeptidase [Roseateles sp.]MBV8034474.1 hypothetical protein [Roseateles sp.]
MADALLSALLRQALLLSLGIALLAVARPMLNRAGPAVTYAAWLLIPLLLVTAALPRPAQEPVRLMLQAAELSSTAATSPMPAAAAALGSDWPQIGMLLWLAGTALTLLAQWRRQRKLEGQGTCLPAGSSPALVGLLRPRIVLPTDFEQRFTPAQQRLVLAHEQMHLQRLDNLWSLLATLIVALHWWNPLAWWALRRLRADQELACDAAVLAREPEARGVYAQALLAAHDLNDHAAPLASRWITIHPLVERISMLNRPRPMTRRHAALLAAGLLLTSTLAWAAQASEAPGKTDAPQVGIELELSLMPRDGSAPIPMGKTMRLITEAGLPTAVSFQRDTPDALHWDLVIFPTVTAPGQIRLVTMSQDGTPLRRGAVHADNVAEGSWTERRVASASGGPDLLMRRKASVLTDPLPQPQAQPGTR